MKTRWNDVVGYSGERSRDYGRPWYGFAFNLSRKHFKVNGTVLEACCGAGEFTLILNDHGYRTVSVDGDPRNIEKLQTAGLEAKVMNLENGLPAFKDGMFDAVVILEGIEHIVNCEYLISECNRVLSREGYFLFSTPNFAWFKDRLRYLFGANANNEGVHLRYFTVASLTTLLKKEGFSVIEKNSFTPLLGVNRIRRLLFELPPVFVRAFFMESVFAQDFVWICSTNRNNTL